MKRVYYLLSLVAVALAPLMLAGCDDEPWDDPANDWYNHYNWYDDSYENGSNDLVTMAQMINGAWTGTIVNEYVDDDGYRQQTRMYADFTFVQYATRSANGTGYETDYAQRYDSDGNPVYDSKGNKVFDQQTLRFKWYVDPRTYNVCIEYVDSKYRFVADSQGNTEYSGFSLGYNEFNGVFEGVNNTEYVFFDLQRVTSAHAPAAGAAPALKAASFGSGRGLQRVSGSVPMALRRR